MEGWMYVAMVTAASAVPALGLSLLCRAEADRTAKADRPQWERAKTAALLAAGGAAAVLGVKRLRAQDLGVAPDGEPESD